MKTTSIAEKVAQRMLWLALQDARAMANSRQATADFYYEENLRNGNFFGNAALSEEAAFYERWVRHLRKVWREETSLQKMVDACDSYYDESYNH